MNPGPGPAAGWAWLGDLLAAVEELRPPTAGEQEPAAGRRPWGEPAGALAEDLRALLGEWTDGLGRHAGPECQVCPVCRSLAVLRQTRPEALDHLAAAATELSAAVRLLAARPPGDDAGDPGDGQEGGGRRGGRDRPDDQPDRGQSGGERGNDADAGRPGRTPRAPVQHIDVTD